MDPKREKIGRHIAVHKYYNIDQDHNMVLIQIQIVDFLSVKEASNLMVDLEKASNLAKQFECEINREKTKDISIEYLVEKGWIVEDMNTEQIKVKSFNHWIAVAPPVIADRNMGSFHLPAIYAGASPLEAYKNICHWASDTGITL